MYLLAPHGYPPAVHPAAAPRTGGRSHRGFTLIETMVTIALLAIILALAVPSFDHLINRNRVQSTGKQLVGLLQYTQAQAQISQQLVKVTALDKGDWGSALLVSQQRGGNLATSRDIPLRKIRLDESGQVSISIAPEVDSLIFDGHGVVTNQDVDYPLAFSLASGSYTSSVCLQRSGAAGACE